jgi:hypothetical protein
VVNSPTNTVSPCGSVFKLSDVIRTRGKKKSFQIGTAFWIATITSAGQEPNAEKGRRWRAPASFVYGVGDQAATAA